MFLWSYFLSIYYWLYTILLEVHELSSFEKIIICKKQRPSPKNLQPQIRCTNLITKNSTLRFDDEMMKDSKDEISRL